MNQTVTGHLLLWLPMVPRRAHAPGRGGRGTLPAMPAPLGKTPTKKMPDIQVFGRDDSAPTRAALRFFRERRVVVHYVDLAKRRIAPGRAATGSRERLGAAALLDPTSRPYRDAGLAYLTLDEAGIVARLLADPRLLRLPARPPRQRRDGRPRRGEPGAAWLRPSAAHPDGRPGDDAARPPG